MIQKLPVILLFIYGNVFQAKTVFAFQNINNDKIIITNSDRKKLEKAEKEDRKSKQIQQEADKIYNEISTKQSELTAEETEKLNNKALDKQIEGLKAHQSSNKIKYEVYISKAEEFWKKYQGNPEDLGYAKSLENNSRTNFQSAINQLKEAEGANDKLISFSTMSSALDLSNKAVEDIIKAFNIYSNTSFSQTSMPKDTGQVFQKKPADTIRKIPETEKEEPVAAKTSTEPVSAPNIYQAINIREEKVDAFNKFIKESYPKDYEKYIIDFPSLDYSDIEAIKKAWYRYIFGDNDLNAETASKDTAKKNIPDSLLLAQQNTTLASKQTGSTGKIDTETAYNSKSETKEKSQRIGKNIQKKSQYKFSDTISVQGFTFRVQVAASRVPLNPEMQKGIYPGPEILEEIYEDEWYKYSTGPYQTYASARQFRESCEIKGAFVVAFVNGRKINPTEALIKPDENSNNFINFKYASNLIFKVQVVASRVELSAGELKDIYSGPEQLENSFEDNWYKYSINCGNDYSKACNLLKKINIEGAFISAYNNGQQVNLKSIFNEEQQQNK